MTIERDGSDGYQISCDSCPEAAVFDLFGDGDWPELMEMVKEDGWTKRNVDGEWRHFCSGCSGEGD